MRIGLQARYFVAMVLALAIVVAAFASVWYQQRQNQREIASLSRGSMHEVAVAGLRSRGATLVSMIADALTNPLYYFDLVSVGEIVQSALSQPDVSYVIVFDADGRIVHDGSRDIPSFGQEMTDAQAPEAAAAATIHTQMTEEVVDVAHPIRIGQEKLGGVRIGLSMEAPRHAEAMAQAILDERIAVTVARNRTWLIVVFAALLAMGLALSLLVRRGLVQPVRRLADAAQSVEAGRFELRLESTRSDELGDLFRAFQRMGDSLKRHDRDIRQIAYGDSLTGLPNRLAFREILDRKLLTLQAGGGELALLFVDLDDFKRVNDTLGHDAGDHVLGQFALRLQHCLRLIDDENAVVARFGGDEFVAMFGGQRVRDAAAHLAEAMLAELQSPVSIEQRQVFLGASVGITLFPQDAHSSALLLKNGDIAMYQAKVAGKNCYRFYSKAMDQAVERRVQLEGDLRGAWARGELSLSYQPIFELESGRLLGAEALMRWQHPELGVIPPSVFVDVAEQTGLIEDIGRLVLQRACNEALRWKRLGDAPFVSVNVSPRQLRSGDLAEMVGSLLAETGLPPERLHLELTETAVLGDELQTGAVLSRLRSMGVKIWLDDFGTGFSGLSHLRRVPVDGVKIDRSFIADMLRDPDDLALTSAIIAMAHSLGITVVGEGVENEGQFAVLRERGCDLAQGYWLGRPMSASELARRLVA
ncbi:MAG TPA: EAL domain-containing protein [Xanthomonadaceae bacterium]|nr:EAL domain-containing protein [Xanthomonadaceae bacterium]